MLGRFGPFLTSLTLVGVAAFSFACSENNNNVPDSGQDNAQQDGDGGDQAHVSTLKWSARMPVDNEEVGMQLHLQITPDNQFALAYYKQGARDPNGCAIPITGGNGTASDQDDIRYAWFDGTSWQHENVITIKTVFLSGVSLLFDSGGKPRVAFLGGNESQQCCGGSDLILATRNSPGNWSIESVVTDSGQAAAGADCPMMQSLCDTGDMVGLWPALAKDSNGGIGVAYRDLHLCYAQTDNDFSDLEYAYSSGSGWSHEWIELVRGGGSYNSLAFGPNNEPAVAHYSGKFGYIGFSRRQSGVWTESPECSNQAQKCIDNKQDTCPAGLRCVFGRCSSVIDCPESNLPEGSISLAIGPDGRYLVAYFDANRKSLKLGQSTDGRVWQTSVVDSDGATGLSPSLVFDPISGKPAVAYYRCGDYSATTLNCDRNNDGVIYAYFNGKYPEELNVQSKWKKVPIEPVDKNALDGRHTSVAILPDGRIGIAYSYNWTDTSSGLTKHEIMFNLGTWE